MQKTEFVNKVKDGVTSMQEMSEHLSVTNRQVRRIAETIKKDNLNNAVDGWLLISGNFGYKITTNVDEIKEYTQRMYNTAMSILLQVKVAEKYLKHEDLKKISNLLD